MNAPYPGCKASIRDMAKIRTRIWPKSPRVWAPMSWDLARSWGCMSNEAFDNSSFRFNKPLTVTRQHRSPNALPVQISDHAQDKRPQVQQPSSTNTVLSPTDRKLRNHPAPSSNAKLTNTSETGAATPTIPPSPCNSPVPKVIVDSCSAQWRDGIDISLSVAKPEPLVPYVPTGMLTTP